MQDKLTRTILITLFLSRSLSFSFSTSCVFPAQSHSFSQLPSATVSLSQGEIKRRIEDKLRPKDGYAEETGPSMPQPFPRTPVGLTKKSWHCRENCPFWNDLPGKSGGLQSHYVPISSTGSVKKGWTTFLERLRSHSEVLVGFINLYSTWVKILTFTSEITFNFWSTIVLSGYLDLNPHLCMVKDHVWKEL